MEPVVDVAHPLFEHVRVNLRRRQVGVPEHHLNGAEVGAALEKVGRKRVSKQRIVPFGDAAGEWVNRYTREARPALLGRRSSPRRSRPLAAASESAMGTDAAEVLP